MGENVLKCLLLSKDGTIPSCASSESAGLDIFSAEHVQIEPKQRKLISTKIAVGVERGYYGRIAPRSGLAVNYGIDVGAGVIDSDYRGEVKVLLFNFGEETFKINRGDRIAQLIIEKIACPKVVAVDRLDMTERGDGGFGSTGK